MKKEVIRKTSSAILSFIAAFLLAIALFTGVISACLSETMVRHYLKETNYLEKAAQEIVPELEAYAIPGGLPEDFFASGVDIQTLEADMDEAIRYAYRREALPTTAFSVDLKERICEYAREKYGDQYSEETQEEIDLLVKYCDEDSYRVFASPSLLRYSAMAGSILNPWGYVGAAALVVVSALLSAFVFRMNAGAARRIYLASTLNGAGLMVLAFPLYVLCSGTVAKLGLTSPCLYGLATRALYTALYGAVGVGALVILAGVLYFLFSGKRKKQN